MKEIVVYPLPQLIETEGLVILIDILRATSTITTALAEEAIAIKPVATVEEAFLYREKGYLLAGERGGLPPEGFDLGNSPREAFRLAHQKAVLTTTNGTKALAFVKKAKAICAASFLNLSATARFANRFEEVILLCAGTEGEISLEDFLFAGFLLQKLEDFRFKNDAATIAAHYAQGIKDLYQELLQGKHAQRLINLGLEEDIHFCAQVDLFRIVPILTPEGFVALKGSFAEEGK